jgi:hypothetical protein
MQSRGLQFHSSFRSLNKNLNLKSDDALPMNYCCFDAKGQVTHFLEKIPTVNDIFCLKRKQLKKTSLTF